MERTRAFRRQQQTNRKRKVIKQHPDVKQDKRKVGKLATTPAPKPVHKRKTDGLTAAERRVKEQLDQALHDISTFVPDLYDLYEDDSA